MRAKVWAIGVLLVALSVIAQAQPQVFGWVEEGVLLPENVEVKVKMDTGALTSSMDARSIERFKRAGKSWVRFTIDLTDNKTGKAFIKEFERPLVRSIKVRGAGGVDHRPVVTMSICLGNKRYDEQFSLRNRGKMVYPVLIGRHTLEHLGAIDVSRTFTVEPHCLK